MCRDRSETCLYYYKYIGIIYRFTTKEKVKWYEVY